jgi:hypothetical protein
MNGHLVRVAWPTVVVQGKCVCGARFRERARTRLVGERLLDAWCRRYGHTGSGHSVIGTYRLAR